MSFLGYLLLALAKVIGLITNIYTLVVVAAALVSWVHPDPYNPIVRTLFGLTEPVFRRIRRMLPRSFLSLRVDISPVIVLLVLVILETVLTGTLSDFGNRLLNH